jgi:hypothetical protein
MLFCVTAIPAPPNDPQHTPAKGGPFGSSLVVSLFKLILGAAEFILLFGFLRFDSSSLEACESGLVGLDLML